MVATCKCYHAGPPVFLQLQLNGNENQCMTAVQVCPLALPRPCQTNSADIQNLNLSCYSLCCSSVQFFTWSLERATAECWSSYHFSRDSEIMFLINIYQRYRICNCTQWTRSGTALHHYSKLTLQIAPNKCMHWLWIHSSIKSAMIRQLLLHCPTQRWLKNVFLRIFNTTAL